IKLNAPKLLVAGFQSTVKIFQPSVLNHDEACWLVEIAIRARITSTSTPAAAARIWKIRSPSGRRWASGLADPAGAAGSACAAVLMTTTPSELLASRDSPLTK